MFSPRGTPFSFAGDCFDRPTPGFLGCGAAWQQSFGIGTVLANLTLPSENRDEAVTQGVAMGFRTAAPLGRMFSESCSIPNASD
ncbi:hypothetical protein RBWH47_02832 [Rhodopirellula baltica WH47]|uniref:Uncharacterized protein n=1 Tax=Rhodopirellula baltica WH47 TaxID=991778 RepID=F2AZD9_RHOBT|nr:hypothetical protein RBWH47_02832 [Rhodopirellula baltica WH47]